MTLGRAAVWVLGSLLVLIGLRLYSLAGSDPFNSYPYMYPDSFDWLYNGLYYLERFRDHVPAENAVPRDILLPLIAALLYRVDWPQGVLVAMFLAHLAGFVYLVRLGRLLGLRDRWIAVLAVAFVGHHGVAHFRFHILSDNLAIYLAQVATFYIVRHLKTGSGADLLVAAGISAVATLAGKYAILPLVVACGLVSWEAWRAGDLRRIALVAAALGGGFSLPVAWLLAKIAIYGSATAGPAQFRLLAPSLANAGFYAHTLAVFFLPFATLLAILAIAGKLRWPEVRSALAAGGKPLAALGGIVLLTFGLVFCYQWQESRFTTYFFFPAAVLAAVVLDAARPLGRPAFAACLAVFTILCLVPFDDPMRPRVDRTLAKLWETNVLARNLFTDLLAQRPQDRFNVAGLCPPGTTGLCQAVAVSLPRDPYLNYTFRQYYCYQLQRFPCRVP